MKTAVNYRETVVRAMGTIMMIVWTLVLGPVGALLLGGVAYAMLVQSVVAGVVCAVLLFLPPIFTLAWGTLTWSASQQKNAAQQAAPLLTTEPIGSSNQPAVI